jgi:hypothetical protein
MKAYLINPTDKTVSEVEYDGNYQSIAPMIHAKSGLFDLVRVRDPEGCADVFVDDEGLLYEGGNPHGYFQISHGQGEWQTLAGYGLVLDVDHEGDTVAATCSLDWITKRVRFAPRGL